MDSIPREIDEVIAPMSDLVPGELLPADEPVEINAGRETASVTVENTGDRPAQVGSHFHFFECNRALEFDREAAYGMRLDIPAGTAVRFEPGCEEDVDLVAMCSVAPLADAMGMRHERADRRLFMS